jgi:cytochrome b pre-mRNA-processing protein 3
MHDPGDDPDLARGVSEVFVDDIDATFREMGVGDLSVPKRVKGAYQALAGRVAAYKTALESDETALAAAIARNVFPEDAPGARAAALAGYLKALMQQVRELDLGALRRGDDLCPPALAPEHAGLPA